MVALLVAGSLVTTRLLLPAIVVGIIFWLFRRYARGNLFARTPGDWSIWLLALTAAWSWALSNFPDLTSVQVLRLFSGIILFYAICNWMDSPMRLRWVFAGVVLACLSLVAFALVGVEWAVSKTLLPPTIFEQIPLLVADAANPNVMAGTLVIFLPLLLGMVVFDGLFLDKIIRATALVVVLLMAGVIFLSQSRGAYLAGGISIAVLAMLRWRWGWLLVIAGLALVLVGIIQFGSDILLEALVSTETITGVAGRLQIWSNAIYMLQDNPFTGIGMGAFAQVSELLYPFASLNAELIAHVHNLFLQIAIDLGIPGLIAWLAVMGASAASAWKVFASQPASSKPDWTRLAGAGLFCGQVALVLNGLLDAVTWGMVRPAPLVWLLWGISMASWNLVAKHAADVENPAVFAGQPAS